MSVSTFFGNNAFAQINTKCYLLPIRFSSVTQLEILNLTSLRSRSGSGPRRTHWNGTQSNSTIVRHTKAKHIKPFLNE